MKIKLNLIPPQKKEEIKKACRLRLVSKLEIEFVLVFIFFIVALYSMNIIVKANIAIESNTSALTEENNTKYDLIKSYDNEIKETNEQIVNIKKIQNNQLYWSKFLVKLNNAVIEGVGIKSLVTTEYELILSGEANTRDSLIIFKDNLVQSDCFERVDLPLSNLVSKDNVEFQISLKIKKECLK